MNMPLLGFVGVGRMGAPMARRLLDAGYPLCVFDTNAAATEPFVTRGAGLASSLIELASTTETILLSLPTPDVLTSVVLGEDGLVHGTTARTLIDFGTTGPATEKAIAAGIASRGMTLVDAPISGGIAGARAGTLAVMVACARATFVQVEPILQNLGRVFYTGETPGLAQVAKLANNMLSAVALAASSEAVAMGVKAGLDPRVLIDIINAGTGRNSATQDKFPRAILPRSFDFGMNTELFLKDVRLCVDEAESLGVPMVIGAAVRQMFAVTKARFGPASDFTCIAKVIEEWAGIEMRG